MRLRLYGLYPDLLVISGQEYKAQRSAVTGTVLLPYKDEPDVKQGDIISHKTDSTEVSLKVLETSFRRIGTFTSANKTPHMLTMKVEVTSEAPGKISPVVAEVTTDDQENDDEDAPPVTIGLQQFIERVSMSNDNEAKEMLKKLLKAPSITGMLGSGARTLTKLL